MIRCPSDKRRRRPHRFARTNTHCRSYRNFLDRCFRARSPHHKGSVRASDTGRPRRRTIAPARTRFRTRRSFRDRCACRCKRRRTALAAMGKRWSRTHRSDTRCRLRTPCHTLRSSVSPCRRRCTRRCTRCDRRGKLPLRPASCPTCRIRRGSPARKPRIAWKRPKAIAKRTRDGRARALKAAARSNINTFVRAAIRISDDERVGTL